MTKCPDSDGCKEAWEKYILELANKEWNRKSQLYKTYTKDKFIETFRSYNKFLDEEFFAGRHSRDKEVLIDLEVLNQTRKDVANREIEIKTLENHVMSQIKGIFDEIDFLISSAKEKSDEKEIMLLIDFKEMIMERCWCNNEGCTGCSWEIRKGNDEMLNAITKVNPSAPIKCDCNEKVRKLKDFCDYLRKSNRLWAQSEDDILNDIEDRLEEQSLEPPNKLRNFTFKMGLLKEGEDFTSKKQPKNVLPSVRMMRTFVVNFYKGKNYQKDIEKELITPTLCETGSSDKDYLTLYKQIEFENEGDLVLAGSNFVNLFNEQRKKGTEKFKTMALNLSIISSWAMAAGLLQKDKNRLEKFYSLPVISKNKDPLNYQALLSAKGDEDPESYRGLATRYGEKERQRLLEIFLLYSKFETDGITIELCKHAIDTVTLKKKQQDINLREKKFFKK